MTDTQKHMRARVLLAKQRQMTSLIDKELIAASDDLIFDRTDWVPLYYDKGHEILSDCGRMRAVRAATLRKELLWLVTRSGKARAYHALTEDPFDAMAEAENAALRRREIKQNWDVVESVANDLLAGRLRFSVTRDDAAASPLCTLGIDGFMRAIGMGRVHRLPGRAAALLMRLEPQMGFVIHEAYKRHRAANRQPRGKLALAK